MEIEIIVKSDFEGFFENLTKNFFKEIKNKNISKVIVSAGPYQPYDLDIKRLNADTITIDYYSAIRVFGHTYEDSEVIDYLNKI